MDGEVPAGKGKIMVTNPYSHPLRVAHLNPRKPNPLTLEPDAAARARIAEALGIEALPAAAMTATVTAAGNDAWELTARLTARVVQPCVVTLAPVETAIAEDVRRVYSPHAAAPEGDDVEMPDDEIEPLGQSIDAGAVLVEALSLALPLYPRAPGAALPDAGGEDKAEARRPFADLAAMLARKED